MSDAAIQELLDRAHLSDVLNRYATGVDTRDWTLFRSCFTDDVEADFTSIWPGLVVRGADEWVKRAEAVIEGLTTTQHIITNHAFDIQGDRATGTAYLHAQHVLHNRLGDGHNVLAGVYRYEFARTPEGWRIEKYGLTVTWGTGNHAIWELAQG